MWISQRTMLLYDAESVERAEGGATFSKGGKNRSSQTEELSRRYDDLCPKASNAITGVDLFTTLKLVAIIVALCSEVSSPNPVSQNSGRSTPEISFRSRRVRGHAGTRSSAYRRT